MFVFLYSFFDSVRILLKRVETGSVLSFAVPAGSVPCVAGCVACCVRVVDAESRCLMIMCFNFVNIIVIVKSCSKNVCVLEVLDENFNCL